MFLGLLYCGSEWMNLFFGSSALIEISAELTLPFPQKRGNKSALFHISNTTMSSQYTQKICVLYN